MTLLNLDAKFLIEQTQLKDDDLHPGVSSKPLIDDELPNPMATPKLCLFIPFLFNEKCILGCFEKPNCLDISILKSRAFFLFSTHFHVQEVVESEISSKEW